MDGKDKNFLIPNTTMCVLINREMKFKGLRGKNASVKNINIRLLINKYKYVGEMLKKLLVIRNFNTFAKSI